MKWFMAWVLLIALTWTAEAQWTNPPGVNVPGGYTSPPPSVGSLVVQMALTNILGSGVQVERVDAHTWRVTATGSAESVQADLAGHKTNETAHLSLLAGKSGTNHNHASEYYPLAGNPSNWLTEASSLGVTNATGGILSLIGRQISLVASNITAALDSVYAAIVHEHPYTAVTNAPWVTVETDPTTTNLLDLAGTRAMTGYSVTLARDVKSRDATSAGAYGAAFGWSAIAGDFGAAFGSDSTAGEYGFVAGRAGKGEVGAFVFSDSISADFNRVGYPNCFSVRASGGMYFETPNLIVTGTVTAAGFNGSGASLTGITAGQVGAVSTNGGTLNGPLLTTVDQIATAPSSDELVTAGWARNIMSSGKAIYMTTNLFNAQWVPTNTTGIGSYVNGDQKWVSLAVTGVNHYVASMIDTNPIPANTPLVGPATVYITLGLRTGSPPAGNYVFSAKPELYYIYDLAATSMTLGDFDAEPQAWTAGSTNTRTFIISWPSVTPTNTYYRAFRLKCTAKGSATTNVIMGVGGTDSSFVQIQQSTADYTLTAAGIAAAGGLTNIPAVITPVTLIPDAGGTATVENVFAYNLGNMTQNVTIVVGNSMTNTAQMRGFFLDFNAMAFSITFPTASFSNVTGAAVTASNAYHSYWSAGVGQSIFKGAWR